MVSKISPQPYKIKKKVIFGIQNDNEKSYRETGNPLCPICFLCICSFFFFHTFSTVNFRVFVISVYFLNTNLFIDYKWMTGIRWVFCK